MNIRFCMQRALILGLAPVIVAADFQATSAKEPVFEALPDAIEAYIYGYPLVTMEMTRRVMTNVEKPSGTRAPMGQFIRMREYPAPRSAM